jgi:hypothetical protein
VSETSAPLGRGPLAVLVLVVLAVIGAGAADALVDPPEAPAAEPVAVDPPSAGTWYCPVTAGEEDSAVLTVAAVGEEPATISVERHRGAETTVEEPVEVAPGSPYELTLAEGEARFASAVRWSGGPVVATWRVEGSDTAGARCETSPQPVLHITGFETTAQSASTLHLHNPFARDAVARVTFGTPTGPVTRIATENVSVPARGTTVVPLNDYEPEQPDLAVTVEVLSGRLVAQGLVALAPTANQPGPTGRDVLTGSPAGGIDWAFAYARADEGSASWLSVYNPNPREAAVEVRVANPLPEAVLGEVSVPAGGVVRVDLADTSSSTEFGVAVVGVNEEPVVVTRLTDVQTSGGAEGVSASAGVEPAATWALVGGGAGDRQSRVALYNPGVDPVTVTVDGGAGTPPEWSGIVLEPNQHTALEVAALESDTASIPVLVRADGPVVADLRVQSPGERLRFWTAGGVASGAWEGPGTRPAVRRDARLSTRPAAVRTEEPALP